MDYKQPDFYHFSEDSLALANIVSNYIEKNIDKNFSLADFGCGCGVVGIEVARRLSIGEFHFIELQSEFYPYIIQNCKQFEIDFVLHKCSWDRVKDKFNLIVSNPPYFISGQGRESPNPLTQKCRSLAESGFQSLLQSIATNLIDDGIAFILGRTSLPSFIIKSELQLIDQFPCAGATIYLVKKHD